MATIQRKKIRQRIHKRIRKRVTGTAQRPRLAVHFSNKGVYAQIIDDEKGRTIVAASTTEKDLDALKSNLAGATKIGEVIADRAIGASVGAVVFDRGGHTYHGKVKALADAARAKGLQF
jgi:large subunit ribosomal protein L18